MTTNHQRGWQDGMFTARRRSQLTAGAAVLVAMLLLAACDWTQFRYGPEHTGFNPSETTIGPANVSRVRLRWSQSVGTQGIQLADDGRQRRGVCGLRPGQALRVRRQHRKCTLVIRRNRGSALCSLGRERCRVRQHGQRALRVGRHNRSEALVIDRRRQRLRRSRTVWCTSAR